MVAVLNLVSVLPFPYFGFPRGPQRRVSAYEISKSTGFHVDIGFQIGFLDFKVDFCIIFKVDLDFWAG